jgi:hypothetical protein
MGDNNCNQVLVRKPFGNQPLARSRRRWEDNTKIDVREWGCGDERWVELFQDRVL